MKSYLLIAACILIAYGCASATIGYTACFGFCVKVDVDKDATPTHVTETIKTVTETRNDQGFNPFSGLSLGK
jgi:hypothetical protein